MNKVIVFSDTFFPSKSVSSFRIKGFVDALSCDHLVDVYTSQIDASHESKNITFYVNKFFKKKSLKFIFYFIMMFTIIAKNLNVSRKMIIMTGSPFYYFLLSPFFRFFGYKVILDFRDPWYLRPELAKRVHIRWFEYLAIKSCNSAIFVNDIVRESYCDFYKSSKCKFFSIENGYFDIDVDSIDLAVIENEYCIDSKVFSEFNKVFVYAGKFSYRDYTKFLNVIKENDSYLLVKVGEVEPSFEKLLIESKMKNIMLIKQMNQCEYFCLARHYEMINLIITSDFPWEASTKVFDSFITKMPILAITSPDSYVSNIVNNNELGVCCENTPYDIEQAILEISKNIFPIRENKEYLRSNLSLKLLRIIGHDF